MKTLPVGLAAHIAGGTTTLADLLKITRTDGTVFAFTSAANDVTISSVLYKSAQGLNISSLEASAGLNVDNLELSTLDDGTVFTKLDVLSGRWRNADFVISRYNWASPSDGVDVRMVGTIGEVRLHRGYVTAELRGLQQYLQQPIGSVSSKTCRARLGDAMCTKDLTSFTMTNTIGVVDSNQRFSPVQGGDAHYASVSLLLLLDGANGTNTFTDSSTNALVPTLSGAPVMSNASTKFGTTSLYLDGWFTGDDGLSYAANAVFGMGSGDFTVEFSFNRTTVTGAFNHLLFQIGGWLSASSCAVLLTSGGSLGLALGTSYPTAYAPTATALNTWYTVAVTRVGSTWTLFIDGAVGAVYTSTVDLGATNSFTLGINVGGLLCMTGHMDMLRVTKGVARYTAAYAIATVPFEGVPQYAVGGIFDDDWFAEGLLTFTSGTNNGITGKIKRSYQDGYLDMSLPMLGAVMVGDTYSIVAGCQKRLTDCATKFSNVLNFQGEPHLPGIDEVTQ